MPKSLNSMGTARSRCGRVPEVRAAAPHPQFASDIVFQPIAGCVLRPAASRARPGGRAGLYLSVLSEPNRIVPDRSSGIKIQKIVQRSPSAGWIEKIEKKL